MKQSGFTPKPCKYCGSLEHVSLMCFHKPRTTERRVLRRVSTKAEQLEMATKRLWFKANQPSHQGTWPCYLRIHADCHRVVTRSTIQLDHVKSRSRHPELKYDISNLKPACGPCNAYKGSRDIEDIPEYQVQMEGAIDE